MHLVSFLPTPRVAASFSPLIEPHQNLKTSKPIMLYAPFLLVSGKLCHKPFERRQTYKGLEGSSISP